MSGVAIRTEAPAEPGTGMDASVRRGGPVD